MKSWTRRKRRSLGKASRFFQRQCAILLALIFFLDFGFHLIAPLFASPYTSDPAVSITDGSGTEHHPDCGIPDHGCALSHHHHFPAVVSTPQFIIPAIISNRPAGTSQGKTVQIPQANRQIRAPPETL